MGSGIRQPLAGVLLVSAILVGLGVASDVASDTSIKTDTVFVQDDSELPPHMRADALRDIPHEALHGRADVRQCGQNPGSRQCGGGGGSSSSGAQGTTLEPTAQLEKEEEQMLQLDSITTRLEQMSNTWCCAVSGIPLFQVPGDRDVFNFGWHLLSQSFLDVGQTYGQQLITHYHRRRTLPELACTDVTLHDASHFDELPAALLELKERLVTWLASNEVEAGPIVSNFFTHFRGTFGNWGIARLLLQKRRDITDTSTPVYVPEDAVFALLPLLRSSEEAEQLCTVGGQLHTMYALTATQPASPRMASLIKELLDGCFDNGRLAKSPQTFGAVLLSADREEQARELFDIAAQRGAICHPKQRPENENAHHKGLTASPFWTLEDFSAPERAKLQQLAATFSDELESVSLSGDTALMHDFIEDEAARGGGRWERTTIFGNNMWNRSLVERLSPEIIGQVKETVEELVASNDGYAFACNGSNVVEIWRLWPPLLTRRSTGPSNIILQLLAPLPTGAGHSLIITAGDESMVLEEGEIGIVDDTFENTLEVGAVAEGGGEADEAVPLVLLHVQLCHPEMHDKAMTFGQHRCPSRKRV